MKKFKTEQEEFWAGEFGTDYVLRNKSTNLLSSNMALFSKVLSQTENIQSLIEFGANIGLNLKAIKSLLPEVELSALEINQEAAKELMQWGRNTVRIYNQSILEFQPDYSRDFVLVKGVLIHINPNELGKVYKLLYQTSKRYICIAEYYNPAPVEVSYRGHQGKLFKRDFAGEIMNQFKDLRLLNYGFVYHKDPLFPQDDITWFLLEKRKPITRNSKR